MAKTGIIHGKKKRPKLEAAAKRIAERVNLAAGDGNGEMRFDPLTILTILTTLLPLLQSCGFFARDLKNPSRLTQRRVLVECRKHTEDRDDAELLAAGILDDVAAVTDAELKAYIKEI